MILLEISTGADKKFDLKMPISTPNEMLTHMRSKPKPGSKWHLDEVFLKINYEQVYLRRAVDDPPKKHF